MEQYGTIPMSPPRSPSWLLTGFPSLSADVEKAQPTLQKRQSLRLRPEDIPENVEPSSPLNLSSKSTAPPLRSKMSLFSLFSRPNVERQRGYAEPDVDAAPIKHATASTPELVIQVQPESGSQRPASVVSGKTTATKWKLKSKSRHHQLPIKDRKPSAFEPLPLFQAYPQSTKDGTLEVSSVPVEALNKAKSKTTTSYCATVETATGDRSSTDTKRISVPKHVANGSTASVELPKKIFVLVTSGYLLQYAEKGTSDRLPEKILHLGKDSAAFACDLVPGKHYVLQISQAVDQDGIIVANTGSIFARLGIRRSAAKRMTSNLILVMPNAMEMESWMVAVRHEIEVLGGKKVYHHTLHSTGKETHSSAVELKKTPSQSHRYQTKRDPRQVSSVTSPEATQTSFSRGLPDIDFDQSERLTIDDIELEARLSHTERESERTLQPPVESTIVPQSLPTVVLEQSSVPIFDEALSEKIDISPAKHTVPAPPWTATRNSIVDPSSFAVPSSPTTTNASQEDTIQPGSPTSTKLEYFSSHNYGRKPRPPPLALHTQTITPRRAIVDESPIIPNYPLLSERMSARLANAYSERNGSATSPAKHRHDSKVMSPSPASPVKGGECESEVRDGNRSLTPPKESKSYHASSSRSSLPAQSSAARVEMDRARKVASFSMPLRVNPTATHGSMSSGNVRRHSRMDEGGSSRGSWVGYALTPPLDPFRTESSPSLLSSSPSPPSSGLSRSPSTSPPARLSLFPNPRLTTSMASNESFRRSSYGSLRQSYSQPMMNSRATRRPISMQVRSEYAPSLGSVRHSTGSSNNRTPVATVPIRGMKPSRPASTIVAPAQQRASSIEAIKALKFDTPTLEEEGGDLAMPLPAGSLTHTMSKPRSRNSLRKSLKGRSSLPDLDFGIPVVGLGPPAPPPQAPLPAPPSTSTTSSSTLVHGTGSINTVAGLGITVS